jgi:hypothetical protein
VGDPEPLLDSEAQGTVSFGVDTKPMLRYDLILRSMRYLAGVTLHIECKACGHQVDVAPAETYVCPDCGASEGLNIGVFLDDSVRAHDAQVTRGCDERGKEFLEAKTGDSYFRKDAEWHDVTQIVNRRDNRYRKRVVRKSICEVLRDEDVPLDQHEPTAVKRRREVTDQ